MSPHDVHSTSWVRIGDLQPNDIIELSGSRARVIRVEPDGDRTRTVKLLWSDRFGTGASPRDPRSQVRLLERV